MGNCCVNIIVNYSCKSSLCNKWTVTGKVSDVIRTAGSQKPDLHFDYDATGQRIAKTVTNKNTTDGTDKFVTTYYVRDPQGSVLAVYEHKHGDSDNGTFTLAEQHLYGAGRLGMRKRDVALNATNANESPATYYELTNHLGNVMAVISDKASTTDEPMVVSLSDYYPYGMTEPGRSYTRPGDDYRFGYTGHEKEEDLASGVYTTEYRLLDTRLGRWMSVDPLAEKASDWSPYRTSFDNPIIFVDPDGQWEADSVGNLIAEKGDHAGTLAKFLNISFEDALKKLKDQGYTVNDKGILNLEVGDKVTLDNVFTQSIKQSDNPYTLTEYDNGYGPEDFGYGLIFNKYGRVIGYNVYPVDDYNCWGSALAGSQGETIKQGVGIDDPSDFEFRLWNEYVPTTKEKAQFGKTVLSFVKDDKTTHGAVYYGKNHAGEIYVYTKNGWFMKPVVMKLIDLEKKFEDYGTVKSCLYKEDSGYYDPKSE